MKFILYLIILLFLVSPMWAKDGVIILTYHSFLNNGTSGLDFSLEEFRGQMEQFKLMGFRFVSLAEVCNNQIHGNKNIVITIDDGHRTAYNAYFEVLKKLNIKPVLFVSAYAVTKHHYFLTKEQFSALVKEGCEIGVHGYYHNYMNSSAYAKDPSSVLTEAQAPGPVMKALLGYQPGFFAYPFGACCPESVLAVSHAGYRWAFLADEEIHFIFPDEITDWFTVPRTIVYRWNLAQIYKALLEIQDNDLM